ncbi:hypothetical protein QBC35DRAFT_163182 [Podospora australis]|uniref:Glycoside Hydrolase Family 61 n=1 Tax=Podospora australis TaxID=1536484 RepID=A0AAN7ANB9_9PEZI|nr:hypothetical protein QBC35DRAFT_163182 [Podospora australis]
MFFTKSVLAAGGLATLSQAHMLLRTPAPYTSPALQSGPIDASGSNFPCQAQPGASFVGTPTPMAKGSKQQMAFTGSAVHGGGSCQVSITYDNPPTKASKWKVIHSIQGGCPARNTAGNLPADPNLQGSDSYEFPIPSDIPSGNATIAWTWLNKIGNREFYMNCAPVAIEGEGGSESALAGLPDMLVANIGNGCTTAEGVDVKFPNPGSSVETNVDEGSLGAPQGSCGGGAAPARRARRASFSA